MNLNKTEYLKRILNLCTEGQQEEFSRRYPNGVHIKNLDIAINQVERTLSYFIERLDEKISKRLVNECSTTDHESGHGEADDILLDALNELGMAETAKEYERLSENFWYA